MELDRAASRVRGKNLSFLITLGHTHTLSRILRAQLGGRCCMDNLHMNSTTLRTSKLSLTHCTLVGIRDRRKVTMLLHMGLEVEACHVLGSTNVTYETFIVEVDGPDVPGHVLVSLERCTTVVTGIVTVFTVSTYVILVGTFVVICLLAHLTDEAPLVCVDDKMIAEGLCSLESLVAVGTHVLPLIGVHLHVALKVLLGGRLIHTLRALVAAWGPVFKHAVHIEADLLGEHLATIITLVLPMPGCNTEVRVIEVLIKLFLSTEHQATISAGVSLPDPSGVSLFPPPSTL